MEVVDEELDMWEGVDEEDYMSMSAAERADMGAQGDDTIATSVGEEMDGHNSDGHHDAVVEEASSASTVPFS